MCSHYSPDLAPSSYHLFRLVQNSFIGVNLGAMEGYKSFPSQCPVLKSQGLYSCGIMVLLEKWWKLIELSKS